MFPTGDEALVAQSFAEPVVVSTSVPPIACAFAEYPSTDPVAVPAS